MRTFFSLLIIALSIPFVCAENAYGQVLKESNISYSTKETPVSEIFSELSKQTGFHFFYEESVLEELNTVTIRIKNGSMDTILSELTRQTGLQFKKIDNTISVSRLQPVVTITDNTQQNRKITGTVTDGRGEPIIGANVVEQGTTNGVVTDIDGEFSLSVPENAIISISYIGYVSQEITINRQSSLRIILREDSKAIEEIVVVGYGSQRRGSVTGSVASIESKEIVRAPISNLTNSLGGKLPGLRSVTRSGEPGSNNSEYDIRGFGSALVIVDGVPSGFAQLDPNEIESISILKDASAAVYGVKAANGVILVTTKKGKQGATRINFNSTFSWQRPTIYPKMANAGEFVELTDEDLVNRGREPLYGPEELAKWRQGGPGYESTDWYKLIVRPWAPQQQYNVNIRGGREELKYFASIGYLDQQGMWKSGDNNYNRFNFRTNVDAKVTNKLSTSISVSGRKQKRTTPSYTTQRIMSGLERNYPTYKPYANDNPDYLGATNSIHQHPLAIIDKDIVGYMQNEVKVFEGSATLLFDASEWVKGLNAKANYYYRFTGDHKTDFFKKYNIYNYNESDQKYEVAYLGNSPSNLKHTNTDSQAKIFQATINYSNTFFDKHAVSGVLVFETRQEKSKWFSAYREFVIDSIDELNAGSDTNKNNEGSSSEDANIGYIGRVNYAYADKYLFEFSFRYDGSSKFAPQGRWGFFPFVSAGWRISEESLIKNKLSFLDDLKLRLSWGRLGDDSGGGGFQYLAGYTYPDGRYLWNDNLIRTLASKGLANPSITWYTSDMYNIGLDFTLWNGLLGGEVDVFYRKRNGLLGTRVATLPGTFGSSLPQENLNSDSDRGFELVLKHSNRLSNGIQYSLKGNISYTRSKREFVERNPSINLYRNWRDNTNDRWKNLYWGYKAIGQFQSYEEIANAPVQDGKGNTTLRPGDIRYKDYNGDNVIDSNDEHIIGRGDKPEIMFGLDMGISWKGIDASVFLQGAANFNTYLTGELQSPFFNAASALQAFTDRWHREDIYDPNSTWVPGKYPSTYSNGLESNTKTSTFWLQNASYLRVKEIQLGYTLDKKYLRRTGIENLRIFVSGYNLFTFTGLDLLDPEAPTGSGQYYPQQKMISVGLNVTL